VGWRFYRRVKVLPGVSVNLSKTGASVSIGGRGAHVTIGPKGTRQTAGIPGTGMSYTTTRKTLTWPARWPAFGLRPIFAVIAIIGILFVLALLTH
jgi:hypothetical protein